MRSLPTITAIIPSKDRPDQVKSLIADLRRQNFPQENLEILVIDDGSTPPYRIEYPDIRLLRHETSQGTQRTRNHGLEAARGEIAFMADDDIEIMGDDFLSRAVETMEKNPEIAMIFTRKIDVVNQEGKERRIDFSTMKPTFYSGDIVNCLFPPGPVDWGHGIHFSRREVVLTMGGYDEIYGLKGRGYSFREESDLHARLRQQGHTLWYMPDLILKHHTIAPDSNENVARQRLYWIAHNHVIFVRRYMTCWPLRAIGFLFDLAKFSWVRGRFRYSFSALKGYLAGWRNAFRDKGPGHNSWLQQNG